jgi:hypothetical protein
MTLVVVVSFVGVGLSAKKTPVQNPIPVTLPVSPIGQITFQNITQRIDEISPAAYTAVQSTVAANALPKIQTTISVGPHTVPSVADVSSAFDKIKKLWAGFRQPRTYYALLYNFEDKAWARKTAEKIPVVKSTGGINGPSNLPALINQCTAPTECSSANSGIEDAAGNGLGQFAMDPIHNAQDPYFYLGGIYGHEYTHSVQAAQFLGTSKAPNASSKIPCWFHEGQPNFNGTAALAPDFASYMEWRVHMAKGWQFPEFTDYSAASLLKVLKTGNPPKCLPPAPIYQLGYGIGALVIEALTAIGGPQSTMAVVTLIGRGQTYDQAFKNVYGISWDLAAPILAQIAAIEYAATP